MKAGEAFTSENVRSIRPGYGLHTRYLDVVLGKKSTTDIVAGTSCLEFYRVKFNQTFPLRAYKLD